MRWSTQISYQIYLPRTCQMTVTSCQDCADEHCYPDQAGQEWQYPLAADIQLSRAGSFTLLMTSSGQEWQFHITTDIKWSRMAISHCYWHQGVENGNFTLLTNILVFKNGNLTSAYWHQVVKNGNFTLSTDIKWSRMAISHCYLHLVNREWQFHIATNI